MSIRDNTFVAEWPNKSYKDAIRHIVREGHIVAPRGQNTFEIQPGIHEILRPQNRLCSMPGRRANPFFNMAENMWILAGKGDAEWICSFNSKLGEYQLDPGKPEFNAPYGRRIRFANRHREPSLRLTPYNETKIQALPCVDQIFHCYQSLKKDPSSRQAVISLWNPIFDYFLVETKDRPCNTTVYFKIRDGALCMTVCNRSNDLHLGLYGVNFVQFSALQEFMAAALNVKMGHYVHVSDSLHIYETSDHTQNILQADYDFDVYAFTTPRILTHVEVKQHMEGLGFGTDFGVASFFAIPDQVISDSMEFRKSGMQVTETFRDDKVYKHAWCRLTYAQACARYLFAYDLYKAGQYDKAFWMLEDVFDNGFRDWVLCGLEFMCRKTAFLESQGVAVTDFIETRYDQPDAKRILHYFQNH